MALDQGERTFLDTITDVSNYGFSCDSYDEAKQVLEQHLAFMSSAQGKIPQAEWFLLKAGLNKLVLQVDTLEEKERKNEGFQWIPYVIR